MRSFVKIKPSRIGDITDIGILLTDIGNHVLFVIFFVANVSFYAKFPNLQYARMAPL